MDCEKFEPLLLDELYEELDEVTSAAVKRHVQGCARCASILNGMRATRRLATVPVVDLPDGFEDRILAATRAAQKVVPITWKTRVSRAASLAGNWAMRPQTTMAAVFLLMIGTSAFVIRSRQTSPAAQSVSVTVAGEPAASVAVAERDSLDDKAAAAAHGAGANAPVPTILPPAAPAQNGIAIAQKDEAQSDSDLGRARESKTKEAEPTAPLALAAAEGSKADSVDKKTAPLGKSADPSNAGPSAGAPYGNNSGQAQNSPPATAPADRPEAQDDFSAATAAYRSRNYAEATRRFDRAASSGDRNAELWAAKSTRDGNGCAAALSRFDAVTQKAAGTWVGNEAMLEAARCQIAMGQLDGAREKLNKLVAVSSHAAQARQAQSELNQVATRRAQGGATGGGAGAAARSAPAPAKPASPAATADKPAAVQSGY